MFVTSKKGFLETELRDFNENKNNLAENHIYVVFPLVVF